MCLDHVADPIHETLLSSLPFSIEVHHLERLLVIVFVKYQWVRWRNSATSVEGLRDRMSILSLCVK